MRKFIALSLATVTVLSAGVVGALASSTVPAGTVKLEAKGLSGTKEMPKGAPTGTGAADFTFTGRKVCWDFTISGIGKPLAAHIHRGRAGMAGPVVVPLGAAYRQQGCTTAPAAIAKAITANPGGFYVNVHTKQFPNGAIRAQLGRP